MTKVDLAHSLQTTHILINDFLCFISVKKYFLVISLSFQDLYYYVTTLNKS